MIEGVHPFGWRSYSVFAFLAGVKNYSAIIPIDAPRGFPKDCSPEIQRERAEFGYAYADSWLTVAELVDFDYSRSFEDRRVVRQISPHTYDHGATCEPGRGRITTFKEFLGPLFFEELDRLNGNACFQKPDRIVFWFD